MTWYEYPTNYSNGTAIDGVGKMFFKYPNFILDGYMGAGWTLLIFLITFGVSAASGTKKALTISCFITFLFSIYFVRLGSLNTIISVTLLVVGAVGLIGSKGSGGYA